MKMIRKKVIVTTKHWGFMNLGQSGFQLWPNNQKTCSYHKVGNRQTLVPHNGYDKDKRDIFCRQAEEGRSSEIHGDNWSPLETTISSSECSGARQAIASLPNIKQRSWSIQIVRNSVSRRCGCNHSAIPLSFQTSSPFPFTCVPRRHSLTRKRSDPFIRAHLLIY